MRSGPIRHMSYARPVIEEFLRPRLPVISVEVDGKRVVDGQRGMVVVANSRQYGLRVDPAHRASVTDGLVDVVFFPAEGSIGLALWMLAARMRRHSGRKGLVYEQGKVVRVRAEGEYQVDGEAGKAHGEAGGIQDLMIESVPGSLVVLAP